MSCSFALVSGSTSQSFDIVTGSLLVFMVVMRGCTDVEEDERPLDKPFLANLDLYSDLDYKIKLHFHQNRAALPVILLSMLITYQVSGMLDEEICM